MAGRPSPTGGTACDRPREWVSLRVDGELSLLEEELLERHLGACEACQSFEEAIRSTTGLLRAAPLEEPSRRATVPALAMHASTRRRRGDGSKTGRRTALVAAAALAAGALVGSLVEPRSQIQPAEPVSEVSLLMDFQQLRELPRTKRWLRPAPAPALPPNPPEGVI